MIARIASTTGLLIELLREGRCIDTISCDGPLGCASQACVLIARQGALESGGIVLVRDAEG